MERIPKLKGGRITEVGKPSSLGLSRTFQYRNSLPVLTRKGTEFFLHVIYFLVGPTLEHRKMGLYYRSENLCQEYIGYHVRLNFLFAALSSRTVVAWHRGIALMGRPSSCYRFSGFRKVPVQFKSGCFLFVFSSVSFTGFLHFYLCIFTFLSFPF